MTLRTAFLAFVLMLTAWATLPAQAQYAYYRRPVPRRVVVVRPAPRPVVVAPAPVVVMPVRPVAPVPVVVVRPQPVVVHRRPVVYRYY